jgi:hypothetical protein
MESYYSSRKNNVRHLPRPSLTIVCRLLPSKKAFSILAWLPQSDQNMILNVMDRVRLRDEERALTLCVDAQQSTLVHQHCWRSEFFGKFHQVWQLPQYCALKHYSSRLYQTVVELFTGVCPVDIIGKPVNCNAIGCTQIGSHHNFR